MSNTHLKVLVLEDSLRDLELISEQLNDFGYSLEISHAENKQGLIAYLNTDHHFDIILSDFKLADFNAFEALEICKENWPGIPFICISGSIGEETAIELLKKGAVDYVLKDRPERLPFAVQRAIEEANEKSGHQKAVKALIDSEHRFKQVAEDAREWIWEVDKNGRYTYSSQVIRKLLGYSPDEIVGKKYFYDFFIPEKKKEYKKIALNAFAQKTSFNNFENHNVHKDGHVVILSTSGSPVLDEHGNLTGYRGVDTDVTEQKLAEKALFQSEEKFRNIFMNHAAVKFIVDPETGGIIEANHAAARFYGWSVEALKNKKIFELNKPSEQIINSHIGKVIRKEQTHFESVHIKADGTLVDVEVFSSAIKIGDRQMLHSIIHDISQRKKAQAQINLLNKAIESSTLAVKITDVEGKIIYVNPFFLKNTGYSLEEVLGKNPRFLKSGFHPDEFYAEFWNTILSGKDWEGEFLNKRKNGELYWVKSYVTPILNQEGEITNFVAIKEDITERKKMLEDLQHALAKAQESDKLKSAFLMNMSHEIRTPMNGILGFMNLLEEPGLEENEKSEFIKIINKSGERLVSTINDIVEISKIEIGDISVYDDVVNVIDLISFYHDFFNLQASEKGLTITISKQVKEHQAIVRSDKHKLDGILMNLVKNAIKFTSKGVIDLGSYIEDNQLCIFVSDTGKGIPDNKQDAVFERFVQADTGPERDYEGAGLGLSIVKAFVKALNGTIQVKSKVGVGSTFLVKVPYHPVSTLEEQQQEVLFSSLSDMKYKILVAEDDEINFLYLERILSKEFNVLHATCGEEVIELFTENPDILAILMDIKMPGEFDGIEATKRIRKINTKVPIIAQTAYTLDQDREIALEAGCNDYIAKPFTVNDLKSVLNKSLFP